MKNGRIGSLQLKGSAAQEQSDGVPGSSEHLALKNTGATVAAIKNCRYIVGPRYAYQKPCTRAQSDAGFLREPSANLGQGPVTKCTGMGCFGRHRIQESGEDAELVSADEMASMQTTGDAW